MTGESWAATGGEVTLPLWLVIVLAAMAGLSPFVASVLAYRAAAKQTKTAALTATAQQAMERNKGYQELILKAAELARSPERVSREQGFAMLDGIAEMQDLSPDNARLVQRLTREFLGETLEVARRVAEQEGQIPSFWRRLKRPKAQ